MHHTQYKHSKDKYLCNLLTHQYTFKGFACSVFLCIVHYLSYLFSVSVLQKQDVFCSILAVVAGRNQIPQLSGHIVATEMQLIQTEEREVIEAGKEFQRCDMLDAK